MKIILLLIILGGGSGSVARYFIQQFVNKQIESIIPYGTLLVNIVGSLIVGVIYGLSEKFDWLTSEWIFFLVTGFCGGFTTFSAFALENIKLFQSGNSLLALLYIALSVFLGVLAVWTGMMIMK